MRTRGRSLAIVSGLVLLWNWTSVNQAWAASDTTSATFVVSAGSLAITVPASRSLGAVSTGTATISGQLGTVTITDQRGALLGSWTGSVQSSDFTTGGATSPETIARAQANYWSGAATSTSGVGTFTPGQAVAGNKVSLSTTRTAFSASGVVGVNSVQWNPTVIINIPSAAVVGPYTGTITHSVA